ncbi:hypothetical protein K439DRAFT_1561212 [Ramaria rubella]|nr:hypothetical protein K439DRAFT_1561212 [Ramaria rubella]
MMVRSVPTHWNMVAEVIQQALIIEAAIDRLTLLPEHNRPRTAHLKRFALNEKEWTLLCQLWPLLDCFLQATKRMSSSSIPCVFEVILIIDILTATLDKFASGHAILPAVHAAAAKGRHILDKYYSLTDDSIIYHVAMSTFVLFPHLPAHR